MQARLSQALSKPACCFATPTPFPNKSSQMATPVAEKRRGHPRSYKRTDAMVLFSLKITTPFTRGCKPSRGTACYPAFYPMKWRSILTYPIGPAIEAINPPSLSKVATRSSPTRFRR